MANFTATPFPPGQTQVMPVAVQANSGSVTPLIVDEQSRLQVVAALSGSTVTVATISSATRVVGTGTAGVAAPEVVTIQGYTSGSPIAAQVTGYRATLSSVSVQNLGSGSFANAIPANANRRYLMIHNPSGVNFAIEPTGTSSAAVGGFGCVTLVPNGSLTYENNFVPVNGMAACGSSGLGLTVIQG